MKLKKEFITHDSEEGQVMVAAGNAGFSGLVRSNHTAAFIVDQLKSETTEEQIVEAMASRYEASREVLVRDVKGILAKLRSIGAIDE